MLRICMNLIVCLLVVPMLIGQSAASKDPDRLVVYEKFSDQGVFSGNKRIRIYLPPNYHKSDERYRVLYLFDGWLWFSKHPNTEIYDTMLDADKRHDELVAEGLIHPAILVAVDRGEHKDRRYELTPPLQSGPHEKMGGLEKNYDFIRTVLKPYIDSTYRTMPEREFTGVAGRSYGGIASFYLAYTHPETFGLAGCMSTSFGWDKAHLFKQVISSSEPKSGTRFWIMDGSFDSWWRSLPAAQAMVRRGWVEGEDIGYYHLHQGRHGQESWNAQMRDMLHFLLRKERPKLLGIQLKNNTDDRGAPIDLSRDGAWAHAMVDLVYEHGFRLNAVNPVLKMADEAAATVDADSLHRIRSVGPGWTTLTAEYAGFESTISVKGYDLSRIETLPLPAAEKPVTVDGDLSEWEHLDQLQYRYPSDQADFRFSVRHENNDLLIAVKAYNDSLYTDPEKRVLQQDTIEFWLDARPDPDRSESRAEWPGWDHLYYALSPGKETIQHHARRRHGRMPDGFEAVCVPADSGFVAEMRIPGAILDQKQKGPWEAVRLNLCHINVGRPGDEGRPQFWEGNWVGPYNRVGSGTFKRDRK